MLPAITWDKLRSFESWTRTEIIVHSTSQCSVTWLDQKLVGTTAPSFKPQFFPYKLSIWPHVVLCWLVECTDSSLIQQWNDCNLPHLIAAGTSPPLAVCQDLFWRFVFEWPVCCCIVPLQLLRQTWPLPSGFLCTEYLVILIGWSAWVVCRVDPSIEWTGFGSVVSAGCGFESLLQFTFLQKLSFIILDFCLLTMPYTVNSGKTACSFLFTVIWRKLVWKCCLFIFCRGIKHSVHVHIRKLELHQEQVLLLGCKVMVKLGC